MAFGIVINKGSEDCGHNSLIGGCGYDYCANCPYLFIGHCTKCESRKQVLLKFFGFDQKKVDEFEAQNHGQ